MYLLSPEAACAHCIVTLSMKICVYLRSSVDQYKIRPLCPLWLNNYLPALQLHQFFLFFLGWFKVAAFVVIENGLDDFFGFIDQLE